MIFDLNININNNRASRCGDYFFSFFFLSLAVCFIFSFFFSTIILFAVTSFTRERRYKVV